MAGNNRVSPVQLAKQMGIKPQAIYSLIKRGRINAYGEKPQMVDADEVRLALNTVRHHEGGKKAKGTLEAKKSPVRTGQIVSYSGKGSKWSKRAPRQVVAEVFKTQAEALTYLKNEKGQESSFITGDLQKRILKGEVHIEHPLALLRMVANEFAIEGYEDLAKAVTEALDLARVSYQEKEEVPEGIALLERRKQGFGNSEIQPNGLPSDPDGNDEDEDEDEYEDVVEDGEEMVE